MNIIVTGKASLSQESQLRSMNIIVIGKQRNSVRLHLVGYRVARGDCSQ